MKTPKQSQTREKWWIIGESYWPPEAPYPRESVQFWARPLKPGNLNPDEGSDYHYHLIAGPFENYSDANLYWEDQVNGKNT